MGKDIDEAASGFGNVFRDRLTYLMNGNNVYGKPVNTQELADEIDISRPAVRKYIKPNDRREVTVPSALVVSRIARFSTRRRTFCSALTQRSAVRTRSVPARATCITPSASVRRPSTAAPAACAGRHGAQSRRAAAAARQAHLQLHARDG